jgi:hypothetical protein
MSFVTGLLGGLTQGVNAFTNRELERQAKQQQLSEEVQKRKTLIPLALEEQRMKFEQEQQLKDAAQPNEFRRKEAEMNFIADVQRKITEKANAIKIETTPGLREALAAGDLGKAAQFVQTRGDESFMQNYLKMARDIINSSPYEREQARQKAITEAKQERVKLGIEKAPGSRGGGSGTQVSGGGRTSPITDQKTNNKRLAEVDKQIEKIKADIARESAYEDADPAIVRGLVARLRELESQRGVLTGDAGFVPTEEERAQAESYLPKTQQQTGKPVAPKQKSNAYNQIGNFFAKWAKSLQKK